MSLIIILLTLGACASEGYSSWVCLCVCVCVCLSGENKLLRSLTPAINGGYSIYSTPHSNVWGNKIGRISKTKAKIKNPILFSSNLVTSYVYV